MQQMILKVLKNKKELPNIFSLILEKPKGFNFYPGQYLDVELPVKDEYGKTRAFTISSSPTEGFLMITPKKGTTLFKKMLEKLTAGDTLKTSHPAGTFTLDESQPAVFIAGGIGITPFRSMLKWAVDQKIKTPITLIYSNSDNNFLFKKELNLWQKQLPNFKIHYIISSKVGRLNKEKLLQLVPSPYTLVPIYYLAGPPGLVYDLQKVLLDLGVDSSNIRIESFDGY